MKDNITKLALDVGNSKIKFILGELSTEGEKIRVLDYLDIPSEGIKRAVVEDIELLSTTILRGLKELESRTGREIKKISLGISNDGIVSKTDHGIIEFEEREIVNQDIDDLINIVKNRIVENDETVIETAAYNIRVNNSGILKTPIGQIGKTIKGDIHLIVIKNARLEPLLKAIKKAGLEVEDMFLNASASAKATLVIEDKQKGVSLIDIGEGITDIAIYKNNKIIYTKSLSIGGMHFVNDISFLLHISKKDSKEILSKLINRDYVDDIIEVNGKQYKTKDIKDIVDARVEDLIEFITKTIEESGFNGYLGKGLAFTGGATSIDAILTKITERMDGPVTKVISSKLNGLENINPSMSTVIGLLLNKLELESKKVSGNNENQNNIVENKMDNFPQNFNNTAFNQEDFEDNIEENFENKKNLKTKIKKWISNFI